MQQINQRRTPEIRGSDHAAHTHPIPEVRAYIRRADEDSIINLKVKGVAIHAK